MSRISKSAARVLVVFVVFLAAIVGFTTLKKLRRAVALRHQVRNV